MKIDKVAGRKEPMWRRRLQNKIKELTKDLSQLEASKDKDISNFSHQGLVDSYRQNRLFENNQRQFYRKLNQEEERSDDDQPVAKESKQFWGNIWSLQIIRRMQNGYKTCEVKLMLKTGEDRYYHRKFEKDTW